MAGPAVDEVARARVLKHLREQHPELARRMDHAYLEGQTVVRCSFERWLERSLREPSRTLIGRIVQQDRVGPYFVSTVFLGIDHGFGGTPLWFETMVFAPPQPDQLMGEEQLQWRYETWEQALAGHQRACGMAHAGRFEQ